MTYQRQRRTISTIYHHQVVCEYRLVGFVEKYDHNMARYVTVSDLYITQVDKNIYMPSELYIYVIDNELQRCDDSIFCVQHFVLFRP